tara:strand:- start:3150 stop:3713 length:564 start_codon:yes stop_codon:yes gene_type:complete
MTFWQDPSLEPKRQYKFILSIPGGSSTQGLREFLVKKVGKPSWTISETEHKFLNHSFWYPGRTTWEAIEAVVVDTVDPTANATQEVMHMLEESGYELPTTPQNTVGWGTASKSKAVRNALGQVKIKTIDADGEIVEEWVLNNAWIQKAAFGDVSYDSEELIEVSLTMRFDNAFVNVINGDGKIPAAS